jgi:hypothetical protein
MSNNFIYGGCMGIAVCLNEKLVKKAKAVALVEHRSIARQIEHWALAGIEQEETPFCIYSYEKDYTKHRTPNAETIKAMQDTSPGIETTIEELFEGWIEPCEK